MGDAITDNQVMIRHAFRSDGLSLARCIRTGCGKAMSNKIHRLNGRCSVCWRIVKQYELDGSRRCDQCAP